MIAALLLLAQAPIELAPEEPKPVETTVAAIEANPKKFDGLVVRLHGYVNSCKPSCTIEDSAHMPGGKSTGIVIRPNNKFDQVVIPLVPTFVELDARYSAGCDAGAVCVDGMPSLEIVTLRGIVSTEPPPFKD